MKISIPVLAVLLATGALGADRHKLDVDPESQDGILLQRIQQEPTQPRKLALLEKYVAEYPKATSIAWVYEQLLPIYMDASEWDAGDCDRRRTAGGRPQRPGLRRTTR